MFELLEIQGSITPGETTTIVVNRGPSFAYTARTTDTKESFLQQFAERIANMLLPTQNYSCELRSDQKLQLRANGPQFDSTLSLAVVTTDMALQPIVTRLESDPAPNASAGTSS